MGIAIFAYRAGEFLFADYAVAFRFGNYAFAKGVRGEIALHYVMRGSLCVTVSRLVFFPFRAVSVRCGAGNCLFGFVSAFTYALFDFVRMYACGRFFCPREHVRGFLRRVGVLLCGAFVPVILLVIFPFA